MQKRSFLGIALLTAGALSFGAWLALPTFRRVPVPMPVVRAIVSDPYDDPLLVSYGRYRDALLAGDSAALIALLDEVRGTYLEYRTLLTLAKLPDEPAARRAAWHERALLVSPDEPLARAQTRAGWLEVARLFEEAGLKDDAVEAYTRALPLAEAISALKKLETRPLVLANIFLEARQYENALKALGDVSAPSVEAPAYRALGEHERALDAFERWLSEDPLDNTALAGRAWTLLSLGRNAEAAVAFAALPSPEARYGEGILARRAGDLDGAVRLFRASGDPRNLWVATSLLENAGRQQEAVEVYLELAGLGSSYAAEAAYRALVLSERAGDTLTAARAEALLPPASYLGVKRGRALSIPQTTTLPTVTPPVLALANALVRVNDKEAAVGELLFALSRASDEAVSVAIAERLQLLGEYRQSTRAAEAWLLKGSQDRRTWEVAYPRAYPEVVGLEAARQSVPPELVWAVMRQESRFYPQAVSRSNAKGLMQFIPSTWDWVAELLKETPGDPFEPADNIRYGAFYLRYLLDYFDGDLELVVPAYNGGQGRMRRLFEGEVVRRNKDDFYRFIEAYETRDYLQQVMLNYEIYRSLYGETSERAEGPAGDAITTP